MTFYTYQMPQLSPVNQSTWWWWRTCGLPKRRMLFDAKNQVIGEKWKVNRLYQLYAQAELPGWEHTNLAASRAPTCSQWHQHFRHISISGIEQLKKKGWLMDSPLMTHQLHHWHVNPGSRQNRHINLFPKNWTLFGNPWKTDCWWYVVAHVQLIGGWTYYIPFLDDAKWLSTVLFLKRKNDAIKQIQIISF